MKKKILMVSGKFSGYEERAKAYFSEQGFDLVEYKINGRMSSEDL